MSLPRYNPGLSFINDQWDGNPLDSFGKTYVNLDGPSERSYREVLKWQLGPKPLKHLKKGQKSCLEVVKDGAFLDKGVSGFTWLGHTSYLMDMGGLRVITDPILYNISIVKRFTDLPCRADQLLDIDYILLSHHHRDHIDAKSIKMICGLNPGAKILTGLEASRQLVKWGISNEIIEAGWYQRYPNTKNLEISYLPAKHWTRRYLTDTNRSLWGCFIIKDLQSGIQIFFGADSGYGIHFKEIAKYCNIDYALLGIGAYEPVWFMKYSHTGPEDALRAFDDLNAKTLIPMHYGTFDLSDEPVSYPEQVLRKLCLERNIGQVAFQKIGLKHIFGS